MHKLQPTLAALLVALLILISAAPAQADTQVALVTTVAGSAGVGGSADGVGPAARFSDPSGGGSARMLARAGGRYAKSHASRARAGDRRGDDAGGQPAREWQRQWRRPAARFFHPEGVAISADGTIALVADTDNHTIRKIVVATAEVTTLAGSAGSAGSADGTGTARASARPAGWRWRWLRAGGRYGQSHDSAHRT